VDIESFSDVAMEVREEVIPDAAAEPSAVVPEAAMPQPADPVGEASAEFIRELELTIHKDEDPVANVPWLKFVNLCLKVEILLPPLLPSIGALVRHIAVIC
jgi:hypothetical protein